MTFIDSLNYITVGNPVSKAIITSTASLFSRGGKSGNKIALNTVNATTAGDLTKEAVKAMIPPLYRIAGRHYNFVRLAGLSGASAVILGAIGSHFLVVQDKNESKIIFDTANRFHFFHSLALIGAPLAKYPVLTGILMLSGTFLFCGTLYYRAYTGDKKFARYAPIGGTCLILAWLTFVL